MEYYFLIASLPLLSLDDPPPLAWEPFRALCTEHMTAGDLAALDELTDELRPAHHPFVRAWRERECQLRNALARLRASRRHQDAAPFLREHQEFDPAIEKAAVDAYTRESPLTREQQLDRFRWAQAESLAGFNPFSGRALLAYALKLRLALRWARQDETQGAQTVESLVTDPARDGAPATVAAGS